MSTHHSNGWWSKLPRGGALAREEQLAREVKALQARVTQLEKLVAYLEAPVRRRDGDK